ncbi:MAG: Gfo/Idh/MocA family oxidoreductase [Desulfovibrio sp.]|nr:Gfo/Idh/MocA family oxidoreductase [Desulfovibrio sp.]
MNIGIIGFGKMGQTRATAIESSGCGKIVKVYDANQELDFRGYPLGKDPQEIIADPSIDAVFICTPNHLNKPLTLAALDVGKHVFCEKPPAFTVADVEEIRVKEAQSGKKLMYGFNHRHHRSIKTMKSLIDNGEYGEVIWMRGRYGKSVDARFFETWRAQRQYAGGGILLDQGIHMVDLFLYLGGTFDQVNAFVSNQYWKRDVEDNVFAILKNSQTGVTASLHSTMTQWRHLFSLEVFLSKGYMVLNGLLTSTRTYGDEILSIAKNRSTAPAATWEDEERITYDSDKSWRSEIDHFFEAIATDSPITIGSSQDALAVMKVIEDIYRSDPSYGS